MDGTPTYKRETHIFVRRLFGIDKEHTHSLERKKLAFQDEVQTLRRLGLTLDQARVYLTLARSGASTVKTISIVSRIPREDVYRIMPKLQKLGLVEKEITAPAVFKASPIEETLLSLVQRRIEETSELQTKAMEMLRNFKQNSARENVEEEEAQFVLIPGREASLQRRRKKTSNAQRSIVAVTSWNRFPRGLYTYAEEVKKALDRGVEIRFVTDKPESQDSIPKVMANLMKNPSFKIRYTTTPIAAIIAVYDEKEVYLFTSAPTDSAESPALWSNNPSLLKLAQKYFEIMWSTSYEIKHTLAPQK